MTAPAPHRDRREARERRQRAIAARRAAKTAMHTRGDRDFHRLLHTVLHRPATTG